MNTHASICRREVVKPVYEESVVLEMSKKDAAHILYILGGIEYGQCCNLVYQSLRNLIDPDHHRPQSGFKLNITLPRPCVNWINSLEDK